MNSARFREPEEGFGLWSPPWLVRCPRCDKDAAIVWAAGEVPRLTCGHCAASRSGRVSLGPDGVVRQQTTETGPWRRDRVPRQHWPEAQETTYELWLRAPCAGNTLWAVNAAHLTYLAEYVGAALRESNHPPFQKLHYKLPTWMKVAKHRAEVGRTMEKLQERLPHD